MSGVGPGAVLVRFVPGEAEQVRAVAEVERLSAGEGPARLLTLSAWPARMKAGALGAAGLVGAMTSVAVGGGLMLGAVGGALLCAGLVVLYPPLDRRASVRRFRRANRERMEREHVYRVDGAGLTLLEPVRGETLPWAAVRRTVESDEFVHLFVSDERAHYLPKRAMSQDDLAAVRALVPARNDDPRDE